MLLTSAGKDIKNEEEILSLLEAIHLPKKLAIIHCPGHQKGQDTIAKGNQMAKQEKKPKDYYDIRETSFRYTPEDYKQMEKLKIVQGYSSYGVPETEDGKSILPQKEGRCYVTNLHQLTHLGTKKLKDVIRHSDYHVMGLSDIAQEVVQNCRACAFNQCWTSPRRPR